MGKTLKRAWLVPLVIAGFAGESLHAQDSKDFTTADNVLRVRASYFVP